MRLTRHTDYALRVLTYLGLKDREDLSTIREISDRYGISENHLMKVVHRLGQAGIIETIRGRGGGIRLAHDPADINIGQVFRICEDDMRLVECFNADTNTCPIAPVCALPSVLDEALAAFMAVVDRHTLEDTLQPRRELARILKIEHV